MAEAARTGMNHAAQLPFAQTECLRRFRLNYRVHPLELQEVIARPQCSHLVGTALARFLADSHGVGRFNAPARLARGDIGCFTDTLLCQPRGSFREDIVKILRTVTLITPFTQPGGHGFVYARSKIRDIIFSFLVLQG